MASVKVNITKITDTSFPIFVAFELTDCRGNVHHFADKLPVISDSDDLVPPCIGSMRCRILRETEHTYVIDTELPDDIASEEGEYQFEVWKDQVATDTHS